MNDEIRSAMEQVREELDTYIVSLSDTKTERRAIRQAIIGGNAITNVIESYHGSEWADKIGSEMSQQIVNELARREAWLDREISRFKDTIKTLTANLTKYEAIAEAEAKATKNA